MGRPYVSSRKLCANAMAAMIAAIELYNKPQAQYREQVVVVLVVNAWELILKGTLRKNGKNVFYKKRRGEEYRSFSLDSTLSAMEWHALWPEGINGEAVRVNLKILSEYRDRVIHLYPAEDLGSVLYHFLQQSILNFRDFVLEVFGKDLADEITWTLLPLAAALPNDVIRSLRVDARKRKSRAVEEFLDRLLLIVDEAEKVGADMSRVAIVQEVRLFSGKKISRADLEVSVAPEANAVVLQRKVDPNETHPFSARELIEAVNSKRQDGYELNTHDLTVVSWKHGLKEEAKYAWRNKHSNQSFWSGDAVSFLARLSSEEFLQIRKEYRDHMRVKRAQRSK